MNILIVCTQGQNRSKYLAEYLASKGYTTDYGGVNPEGYNPLTQEKVDWADIVVTVREHIKNKFLDRLEPKGKRVIHLEVIDNPKRFSQDVQELADKDWWEFQEKYVYFKSNILSRKWRCFHLSKWMKSKPMAES